MDKNNIKNINLSRLFSNSDKKITTLVLSGGGIKGFTHLGALYYLSNVYLLEDIKSYYGTSIGAIICFLLIIGYTPISIISYLCKKKIIHEEYIDILNFTKDKGLYNWNIIGDVLIEMTLYKLNC